MIALCSAQHKTSALGLVFRLSIYLYGCSFFYETLSCFHDIETNCSEAMKATPLINSLRMAFYLVAFDVRRRCRACARTQLRAPFIVGGPRLAAATPQIARQSSREAILQKILTVGHGASACACVFACLCLERLPLREREREIANAFVCGFVRVFMH